MSSYLDAIVTTQASYYLDMDQIALAGYMISFVEYARDLGLGLDIK